MTHSSGAQLGAGSELSPAQRSERWAPGTRAPRLRVRAGEAERSILDEFQRGWVLLSAKMSSTKSPGMFFLLVLALGAPFVLVGELSDARLLANIPVSGLQFVVPLVAAVVLVARSGNGASVGKLLRRGVDSSRIKLRVWYLPILLQMPTVTVLAYWLMRLTGHSLPEPRLSALEVLSSFAVYVVAAACEEAGGAVTPRIRCYGGGACSGAVS